jgi:hypothetical protein
MPRLYYKEPDTKYGRPKKKIAREPPSFFRTCDEEMKGWGARRFLKELIQREISYNWEQHRPEWEDEPPHVPPGLVPITDLDEINAFLCRLPAVSQVTSKEAAIHALESGLILIAVDPHTPNLSERLGVEAKKIRAKHPLPMKKKRGRPSDQTNIAGIDADKLEQWRTHRIIALHELRLSGYKARKQIAKWMFPEIKGQRKRGDRLDRAVELLDEALAAARMIDAQTR